MRVTAVRELERKEQSHDYAGYRGRQRSKSRDNSSAPSGYTRGSGERFSSRSASASRGRSPSNRRSDSMGSFSHRQRSRTPKIILANFTRELRGVYNKKVMSDVDAYIRDTAQYAVEMNNINFLMRCVAHRMIPVEYWVDASELRKTREVLKFLEQCASRLMLEDIRMQKKETAILCRSITSSKYHVRSQLSGRDFTRLEKLLDAHYEDVFDAVRRQQRDNFTRLQQLSKSSDHREFQTQGGSDKASPGQGRQRGRNGRQNSERKSRSGSDSSSVPTTD